VGDDEGKGCALGIAADHPSFARVDDLAAESTDLSNGGVEVWDGEVGERETVARAGAALVHPDDNPLELRLPAAPILTLSILECELEQPLPKAPSALRVVDGELDQEL
jgi:hypothetical protein